MRIHPQLDHRTRQDDPLDARLSREQRHEPELGLQRLHRQRRRAAHAGRGREGDIGERDGDTRKEHQRCGPGHHEVAAGVRFDLLDQTVTHQIDGRSDEQERDGPEQQAAKPQPSVTGNSQPAAALRASAPGLGAAHLGPRRRMVRHGGDLGRRKALRRCSGCCNQHNTLVQIMSRGDQVGAAGPHFSTPSPRLH